MPAPSRFSTAILTLFTLIAFAGNSLLCRMALEPGTIDPVSFTTVRIACGTLVLLPFLRPGLVAGGLLAFTLSLDDFVITFFTSGPDTVTFPVKVYSMVRFSVTPEINAASTVLILLTLVLTFVAVRYQRIAG